MPAETAVAGRELTFAQAVREATDLCMEADPRVYLMGEGVPDPKGIFGTTLGLREKYGPERVLDMPLSENGMTGVAIGSALSGMRPILTHQRVDFALYAMDQMVNNAAKWHYMFGGGAAMPLVVRLVIGRGWGQGPQHSQSLQAWFAHIPGLKVVMPATARDAKGLLVAAIEDDNPVIFLEHRWLHHVKGIVPEGRYATPLGECHTAREGRDLTLVATSYMTLEALRAAELLEEAGVSAEVIDVRTLRPLDTDTIVRSAARTGRLLVTDTSNGFCGFAAEIVALVAEEAHGSLVAPPRRLTVPEAPSPCTPALARHFYPRAVDLARAGAALVGVPEGEWLRRAEEPPTFDQPDPSFTGPF